MTKYDQLHYIFRELDFKYENGLVTKEKNNTSAYQDYFFNHVKNKLNIDAIYFLRTPGSEEAKVPLIYFSAMDTYDSEKVAELHRLAWNLGEAPLLFIVLPDQLLVFNNYKTPHLKDGILDPKRALVEKIRLFTELEKERHKLSNLHRKQLESGELWSQEKYRFNHKYRVDYQLINNLKRMREELLREIKSSNVVHCLLGRAILMKYLNDRKDSTGKKVFPEDFFNSYLKGAKNFTDVLLDKKATYELFNFLCERFNGDLFPVEEDEINVISQEHLLLLRDFLTGEIRLSDKQLALFPLYTFDVIPIQLISSIYELFFHMQYEEEVKGKTSRKGTYYTPHHLVELLLDEIIPWEGQEDEIKILDPSCGSGVFLVEAYRRLVGRWTFKNKEIKITPTILINIMKESIYGVDCNDEALRIASFSLCLTMCDYLDSETIWNEFRFPALRKSNLFATDFFNISHEFNNLKFDVIVGNPPWESLLSNDANEYILKGEYPIGDKQIAQAFAWRTLEFCKPETEVCLLLPSKGLLFNRSKTNSAFRKSFFSTIDVSTIINLSVFRKVLFSNATGPASALYFKNRKPEKNAPIIYCSPKPKYTIEDQKQFIIEPNDICRVPRDLVYNDFIWKIAMWGGPRDLDLISKIMTHPNLASLKETHDIKIAEGFKVGNKKKHCPDFLEKRFIHPKDMVRYQIVQESMPLFNKEHLECTVEKNRAIFEAPHVLIKQSPKNGSIVSAYLDFDAVFGHSILGIHGDSKLLKFITLLINSRLFSYFSLMTSRRWLIERDELEAGEIESFPIPIRLWNDEFADNIEVLFDRVNSNPEKYQHEVEEFVSQIYNLTEWEMELINDSMIMVYGLFNLKGKSLALEKPNEKSLNNYSSTVKEILKSSFGSQTSFNIKVHQGKSPLIVTELELNSTSKITEIHKNDSELDGLLSQLDGMLLAKRSEGVFVRRNVRLYESNKVFIVKPNKNLYWSYSAACRDADEMFADIMRSWRKEQ